MNKWLHGTFLKPVKNIFLSYVFVDLEKSALQEFIEKYNGMMVDGRALEVEEAKEKISKNDPTSVLMIKNVTLGVQSEKLKKLFPGCVDVRRLKNNEWVDFLK